MEGQRITLTEGLNEDRMEKGVKERMWGGTTDTEAFINPMETH